MNRVPAIVVAVWWLALVVAPTVYAQEPSTLSALPIDPPGQLHFDHPFGGRMTQVQAMLQDRDGYMWFAELGGGLHRYDGYGLKHFTHDVADSTSANVDNLIDLLQTRDGAIWIASDGSGFSRYDPITESFAHFRSRAGDPNSLSSDEAKALLEDSVGSVWIATSNGMNRMNPDTGEIDRFLEEKPFWSVAQTRDGAMWFGGQGLWRLDPATGDTARFVIDPSIWPIRIPDTSTWPNAISDVHVDERGRLWLGTFGGGLHSFDPQTEVFTEYRRPSIRSGINNIYNRTYGITLEADGSLWFGTIDGLHWLDPNSGTIETYQHDPLDPRSIGDGDWVTAIYRDRQGVLWVSTSDGSVGRVDRASRPFHLIAQTPGETESLQLNSFGIEFIHEAPDGSVWVSSAPFLNHIDPLTGTATVYQHDPLDPNSLPESPNRLLSVNGIFVEGTGRVWVGTRYGLARMDPSRPGHFTHFPNVVPDSVRSTGLPVYALYQDRESVLWAGVTWRGLSRVDDLENGRFTYYPLNDSIGYVNSVYQDQGGAHWVGTGRQGLFHFDASTGDFTRRGPEFASTVYGICERSDDPGVLWLGTYGFGLTRFDTGTDSVNVFNVASSDLPDNGVQGVLCDDAGNVWVSTDVGITRYNPDARTFKSYDLDNGLQDVSFNATAWHVSPFSGRFYFGGPKGVNSFFPAELSDNPNPPQLNLTTLSLFGEAVSPGANSALEHPLSQTSEFVLHHDENDITFEYVGLHYSNPEANTYAYKLEPYQTEWREVGTRRAATFTNLDPGEYTFRVKAANSDGVWTPEGVSVRMTILPPWWRTTWAYILYGLLFAAGVFAVDRFQRRRLIQRERDRARDRELEQAREIEKAYTELRETKDRLVQQEKLASLGQLTAGIAHELKNPLNFVNNFAELNGELAEDIADAVQRGEPLDDLVTDLKQNAALIAEHGKRADGIIAAMMQHAGQGTGERARVDVNELVQEAVRLAGHAWQGRTSRTPPEIAVTLGSDAGETEMVRRDISRVVISLLDNAFDAVADKAALMRSEQTGGATLNFEPVVRLSTARVGGAVQIRVADNGAGVPDDIRDSIFQPLFTTKPTGSGTGLGLSLAHDIIVQGHGGSLTCEPSDAGASFLIELPA